jgi:dolichyl-phosphate-mannose-protein mannosyltransferase
MDVREHPARGRRLTIAAASCVTLAIGLVFVFVRAPHPWGWEGIDHYHELALLLAHGAAFPTTDVPWGYAYFLAAFYRLAGDHPWVPLTAQVVLNALVPPLLYALVRRDLGERVALTSAVLASVLSFNTIYASTQSSDAVCTVLFLAGLVALREALATGSRAMWLAGGVLAGLASQFRPNLLPFPAVAAAVAWVVDRQARRLTRSLVLYVIAAAAVSAPWAIRNYRLTGEFIPTSTHGGVQLWYGTLQTGPYLTSRVYNPRSVFEASAFDYSSLAGRSLVVTATSGRCARDRSGVRLIYWTDRDSTRRAIEETQAETTRAHRFEIPAQPIPTAVYYYFSDTSTAGGTVNTPAMPEIAPFVFFVDDRHLADLDRHGDLVSAFTFVRAVRAIAWHETPPVPNRLDLDHDGVITEHDLQLIARALANAATERGTSGSDLVAGLDAGADSADVRFVDGSTLSVPRSWHELITDVVPRGVVAQQMCVGHMRAASLPDPRVTDYNSCQQMIDVRVNDVFYRREPHLMRRYMALAFDNIRRDPLAFVVAGAYRALRLFVVGGTSDSWTAQQFEGSHAVYLAAGIVSGLYLVAGLAGIAIAIRRRATVWLLLVPVLYVPITISYVLTNMRYTVTIQPLLFAFVAVAVTAVVDRVRRAPGGAGVEAARSSST